MLNSFLNYSNPSCKANPDVPPRKNISNASEKENLINKTDALQKFEMKIVPKEVPGQLSNPSEKNNVQATNFQKNELSVVLEQNCEVLEKDEEKIQNSNSLGSNESLKQNSLCNTIMKNLISQLTSAEQLFQKSHEENQKKMESSSKLSAEDGDSERAKEVINKPLTSKNVSNLRKIFEPKESRETFRNSNYSSSSSCHNQVNVNRNSKHVDLSKLSGNGEEAKIKHSTRLNSAIIDKIKEKVFSASKGSLFRNKVVNHNNAIPQIAITIKIIYSKTML